MMTSGSIVTPVSEQASTVAQIRTRDVEDMLLHEDGGNDEEDFPAFQLATNLLAEELDRVDAQGFGLRVQPWAPCTGEPLERARRVLVLVVSLVAMDCLPVFTDAPDSYSGIVVAEFRGDGLSAVLTLRGVQVVVEAAVHNGAMPVSRDNRTVIEPVSEVRLTVDGIRLNADPLSETAIHIGQVFRASFAADWRMRRGCQHQPGRLAATTIGEGLS